MKIIFAIYVPILKVSFSNTISAIDSAQFVWPLIVTSLISEIVPIWISDIVIVQSGPPPVPFLCRLMAAALLLADTLVSCHA